jgi:peptide/nickel transport system substrate-binding protein
VRFRARILPAYRVGTEDRRPTYWTRTLRVLNLAIAAVTLLACSQAAPDPSARPGGPASAGAAPRSGGAIRVAWPLEPENLNPKWFSGSGVSDFVWLFNSFLTYRDFGGAVHPMLARSIPSQDDGSWRVNPDGTMVTTYQLRENARWHDGTSVTAGDFAFAFDVYMDRSLPVLHRDPENLMASVAAPDERTIVITWREPYVEANALGYRELNPLPRHLLEERYRTSKGSFLNGDDWTTAYVGTGPFRLDRWSPGAGLVARANPDWFLGAPKLESIDVRFVPDPSTLLANLLAGEIDLVNSPGIRANEAVIIRDRWQANKEGYLNIWATRLSFVEFQFRSVPGWQRAVTDSRVRSALMYAIDRQGLVDTVNEGLGAVAEAQIATSDAAFPEIDRGLVKHPYDPARAVALLAEAGWRRDAAGMLVGPAGQTLDLDVMSIAAQTRAATIIADNWKSVGANAVPNILPAARERDRELRTSFSSTQLSQRGLTINDFVFITDEMPRPETGFVESNRGSFADPDVDRFHRLARTALDERQRHDATVRMHQRISELEAYAPLFYSVEVLAARNRLKGPVGNHGSQIGITWNAFEWDVVESGR